MRAGERCSRRAAGRALERGCAHVVVVWAGLFRCHTCLLPLASAYGRYPLVPRLQHLRRRRWTSAGRGRAVLCSNSGNGQLAAAAGPLTDLRTASLLWHAGALGYFPTYSLGAM